MPGCVDGWPGRRFEEIGFTGFWWRRIWGLVRVEDFRIWVQALGHRDFDWILIVDRFEWRVQPKNILHPKVTRVVSLKRQTL